MRFFESLTPEHPVDTIEHRIIIPDGSIRWQRWSDRTIFDPSGTVTEYQSVGRDITEQKRAEENLRERERVLTTLISNLPGFAYRCANDPEWTMEYISDGCREITGYAPGDFRGNKTLAYNDIVHPEFQKPLWDKWQNLLEKRGIFEEEYPLITKTGETRWVWERGQGIFSDDSRLLYLEGFITDITERKVAEDALKARERSYRTLSENLPGIVYRVHIREKGRMQFFNNLLVTLTGYNEEELTLGEVCSIDPLIIAGDRDRIITEVNAAIKDNRGFSVEYCITHKDGNPRFFIERGRPVFDDDGLYCIDGIIQDITDHKRAEETIRSALAEKEILLQEIQHRVKNNLAGIIALIDLQISSLTDPTFMSQFKELETRIRSMALVHGSLNVTKDLAWINVASYTKNLIQHLFQVFGQGPQIQCRIDMGDVNMPIETAIPCGLVMNEFVPHSLKYAFPDTFS